MILEPRCNSLSFFLPAPDDHGDDDDDDNDDDWCLEQNIGMYGTECHRGLWALTISPALCPRKARERQEPRRSKMAFTNLRPAVASAPPAADDEQHYLLV